MWNGIECGKTKVVRISRQPSPLRIMIDEKQLENMDYFNCLESMIRNDTRYTSGIKFKEENS